MNLRYLSLLLTLALGTAVPGAAAPAALDDLVLASVNDEPITRGHLVQRLVDYRGDEALERVINLILVRQAAKKQGIVVSDEDLKIRHAEIRARFKSDEVYRAFLRQSNLREEQHRDELRNTMLMERVTLKDILVTNEDLKQYDIRMVVAPDQKTAEAWVKLLTAGEDFNKLAGEKNEDRALQASAGKMQPFLKVEMLDVGNAIEQQKLKPGQFTQTPVRLANDKWVLIKLENIVQVATTSASERERLTALVTRYHMDQWLSQARARAEIRKQPLTQPVVASVNGEEVTRDQLVARLLEYQGEEELDRMVNRTLLLQSAKQQGVSVPAAEADKKLADVRARFRSSEEYQAFLTRGNLTEKQLRDEILYNSLMEKVVLKESPVTDEDLTRYEVRMIVAPDQKTAQAWIKDLDGGADFRQVALERSQDPEGRLSGGKMRLFMKVELLDVWRALSSQGLKPGGYTRVPVLLTDNSWVILKLESLHPIAGASAAERARLTQIVTTYRVSQWLSQTLTAARSSGKIAKPVPLGPAVIHGRAG